MEVTMFFSLLLLLTCSLSTAELQTVQESNNEIIPQGEQAESQGRRPANTLDICPGDIHAVLREMSALLAEQKVEIRHLQKDNEALTAQMKELELQKTGLENVKKQVHEMFSVISSQSEELTLVQARTNVTENQVDALTGERNVKVAFFASLLASGHGTTGPFNTHTTLVFRNVVANIGNAYNPHSGFFIAPVRGVYRFEFYISAYGHPSHPTAALLVRNGQHICGAYEHQTAQYVSSANAATLLLEAGDVMYLQLWSNCVIFDDGSRLSTFSGHLLYTM